MTIATHLPPQPRTATSPDQADGLTVPDKTAVRPFIALVDAVHTGGPFIPAAESLGFCPVPVHTLDASLIATFEAAPAVRGHAEPPVYARTGADALDALTQRSVSVHAAVAATEPGVVVADQLAAALGLPHNPVSSVLARRDKIAMRERARACGVPQPAYRVAAGAAGKAALGAIVAKVGFPAMVKEPAGAGSHNVFLISAPADLRRVEVAADVGLFGDPITAWIVEEYVRGDEYAINTFSFGGQHALVDVWRKRLPTTDDYDQPYWNANQVDPGDRVRGVIERFAFQVLDAFEIKVGPCHIEVKLGPRGPVLIELGARLPGAHIPELWRMFGHADPFADTILARLGRRPRLVDAGLGIDRILGLVFIGNDGPGGVLRAVRGLAAASGLPGVAEVRANYRVGDLVPATSGLNSMLLTVTVSADTEAELLARQDRVRAMIRPVVSR